MIELALQQANSPVDRRRSGQAGAPRRRDLPLLDRAARSPREHHQDHRRASGAVVGDRRPRRRQPARARQPRMAGVAVPRAGAALDRPASDPRASRRGDRADRHVRAGRRDQARGRPRRLRLVHPVDDPLGRRHSRRLSAGQGGRRLSRRRRHRDLRAAHRAAVRDHRRSRAPRPPSCARRSACR